MCIAACAESKPPRQVGPGPVNCTVMACPEQRNFIIVYGDPGEGGHNTGRLAELAARTHEREVRANTFPGVPTFKPTDNIAVAHVSRVSELVAQLSVRNVVYLAYFGHSGPTRQGPGALYLGEGAWAGSNLTNRRTASDLPPTEIPADYFRSDAQVRLFGCRGGVGSDPIAQQMADHLRIPVFAYINSGGAFFTTDAKLGHGGREVTQADIKFKFPKDPGDVWSIPINGTPTFSVFNTVTPP